MRNNLVTQANVKLLKELRALLIMKKLVITKLPMGIDPTAMELLPQTQSHLALLLASPFDCLKLSSGVDTTTVGSFVRRRQA